MAIPLPTLAPTVNAAGITIPPYSDILATLQDQYRSIFGSDVYLEPDSQDGQWLAILASAVNDSNMTCVAVYNQFSPATAVGAGLSSVVKINGLRRQVPTNSAVDVLIVGETGTTITDGIVGDDLGQRWSLPSVVNIPPAGEITVTATAAVEGALEASPGTVTRILTPTRGWQTVTNASSATPGAPVESDAALRQRQAKSTALASVTPLKGLVGLVGSLAGVTEVKPYENDTSVVDANGLPAHSVALVVEGGDAQAIAAAIKLKKTIGTGTFGNVSEFVDNGYGVAEEIRFSRPTNVGILVEVSLTPLAGYTTAIGVAIRTAVAAYINGLTIGADVILTRLYLPVNLYGVADSATYEATGIRIKKTGGAFAAADIVIGFDEVATCSPDDVSLVT